MNIKTTVNIDIVLLERLQASSNRCGMSKNRMITLLLEHIVLHLPLKFKMFHRLRYQERRAKERWHTLHVSFSCPLYEHCYDLRKFCKFSLSLILAYAIDTYLEQIEKQLTDPLNDKIRNDNYLKNYTFIAEKEQIIPHFHIYWGMPEEKKKKKKK
jgi:hypothetical protein